MLSSITVSAFVFFAADVDNGVSKFLIGAFNKKSCGMLVSIPVKLELEYGLTGWTAANSNVSRRDVFVNSEPNHHSSLTRLMCSCS